MPLCSGGGFGQNSLQEHRLSYFESHQSLSEKVMKSHPDEHELLGISQVTLDGANGISEHRIHAARIPPVLRCLFGRETPPVR